jgi:hypothetical protein
MPNGINNSSFGNLGKIISDKNLGKITGNVGKNLDKLGEDAAKNVGKNIDKVTGDVTKSIDKLNGLGKNLGNLNNLGKNLNLGALGKNFGGLNSGVLLNGILSNMKGGLGAGKFNVASALSAISSFGKGSSQGSYATFNYKYSVKTFQLLIEGRKEPINILNDAIKQVIITKDFDKCIHPILEIITLLPPKLHQLIKDNKQKAKIHLDIKKDSYTMSGHLRRSEDFINNSFSLIMDDESDFKEKKEYEQVNKANGGDGKEDKFVFNTSDYTEEFTLSLWNTDHIDAMRKVVNDIYKNCTISTAITNLYSKATGIKKILISPLDNTKKYSEIRIKPMNLMNIPDYLDKVYGTYYTGSSVFLDFNRLYFLSKNGVCDAKEKGEYTRTIFTVVKPNDSRKNSVGTTKDKKNKFYFINLNADAIDFTSPGNTKDVLSGNNFDFIDPKNNETTMVEGVGEQNGSGNHQIIEDNYNNEYNKSTKLSDVVESSKVATITIMDYDDDAMTPNKEFVINFQDPEFQNKNGFYRLTDSQIVLNKSDASLSMTGIHHLVFKAPIGSGDNTKAKSNKAKATTLTTMAKSVTKSEANKSITDSIKGVSQSINNIKDIKGNINKSIGSFKPSIPLPKIKNLGIPTVNVTGVASSFITKNAKFNYDSLGNLKGIKLPSYKKITKLDNKLVKEMKLKAQQALLPSKTPQPKVQKL